jgi:hypothetical protein
MQEDGINNLTVFEWLNNRRTFKKNGRSSESKNFQKAVRKAYYRKKLYEYMSLAGENYDLDEIKLKVGNELKDLVALHNPDQIAGGDVKDVKVLGDKRINSSIGSQWGAKDSGRAQYIEDEILKKLAGPPEIKEEQQKQIKMNVIFADELELIK